MGNGNGVKLTGVFENFVGSPFGDFIRDGAGPNKIDTRAGDDNVFAFGGGDDWIIGGAGGDTLRGGPGNDLFDGVSTGADGADIIIGGDGFDTLDLAKRSLAVSITTDSNGANSTNDGEGGEQDSVLAMEHVVGGSGNDFIALGENAANFEHYFFEGRSGDDFVANRIVSQSDNGLGDSTMLGDDGNDTVLGGDGNDLLEGGAGDDQMFGSDGNDAMTGGAGDDSVGGGAGDDVYREVPGSRDELSESGADTDLIDFSQATSGISINLSVRGVDQSVDAAGNQVRLVGDFENVTGSRFDDHLIGHDVFDSVIHGGDGNDTLEGLDNKDSIFGENGNDQLFGRTASDLLDGGAGNDTLDADGGFDVLLGGSGDDILVGGFGNDTLNGGTGNDQLFGDAGDDLLIADDGQADTIDGGSGDEVAGDTAVFDPALDILSNCENPFRTQEDVASPMNA